MQAYLTSATPLPEGKRIDAVDFNPEITAMSWSTGLGGFVSAQVGFRTPGQAAALSELLDPVWVRGLGHCEIHMDSEAGFLCFEGRNVEDVLNEGMKVSALTLSGYGGGDGATNDLWFYGPSTQPLTAIELLRLITPSVTAILSVGPPSMVEAGHFGATAYPPSSAHGRYLGQTIDQIVKAGDDQGNQAVFAVYEDRVIQLRSRVCPLDENGDFAPDYRLPADFRLVLKRNYRKLVGTVSAQYTPQGGTQQVTDAVEDHTFRDQYGGLIRGALIPASVMNKVQAELFTRTYLERYRVPVLTGTFTATEQRSIENRWGMPVPWYMPRYGEWIEVGGAYGPMMITKTATDASARPPRTTITFSNAEE